MAKEFETKNGENAAHVENGEWIEPTSNPFGHGCCDCGLFHCVLLRIVDNKGRPVDMNKFKVQMKWTRDGPETDRLRKHQMEAMLKL